MKNSKRSGSSRAKLDKKNTELLRDPSEVVGSGIRLDSFSPDTFRQTVTGAWWDILHELGATLIATREYEHLAIAFSTDGKSRETTVHPLPHPSGIAYCPNRKRVYIASTRNPNQVVCFAPAIAAVETTKIAALYANRPLMPETASFFPGRTYLHDLAVIGKKLHGTATGMNTVCRLDEPGRPRRVWWPKSVESDGRPNIEKNYIQLNSIAAGRSIRESYFTASCATPGRYRPGHLRFSVDGQGVVFSGRSREPIAHGLTRPHSLRLSRNELWVANSGYGEVGVVQDGEFHGFAKLPGWTRGLAMTERYIFAATSRILPRFEAYAPGLNPADCRCGIHVVSRRDGAVLGSVTWPFGNQVFGVELVPRQFTHGFATSIKRIRSYSRRNELYYSFSSDTDGP